MINIKINLDFFSSLFLLSMEKDQICEVVNFFSKLNKLLSLKNIFFEYISKCFYFNL
jgi:hypothetical protein